MYLAGKNLIDDDCALRTNEEMTAPPPSHHPRFQKLLEFLSRVPAIETNQSGFIRCGSGFFENGNWWIKFQIDIDHKLAWSTVQEMGYVLNYLSLNDRLPTVFMPVSPPPYMNGGPEFLSWVIESTDPRFLPDDACEFLEGRMPKPVDDPSQWPINDPEFKDT